MEKQNKIRYYITTAVFGVILFGLAVALLLLPDQELSYAERRKLAQAPAFTAENLFSREYSGDLESYLLDQFPGRDRFRTVKALLRFDVFRQKDNNGIYMIGDGVYKIEYPLKENEVTFAAQKMNAVRDQYFPDSRVFYSVIPDKSYYIATQYGYPIMDYARMHSILQETTTGMEYIDLFGSLRAVDYYRTDSHWKQQALQPVVETLCGAMGTQQALPDWSAYEQHTLSPFYGVYCGQSALTASPDEIIYLTSSSTQSAVVHSVEQTGVLPVYTLDKFDGMDGYDVFLSGAQALMTIENPNATTEKELVIFRDSYGSSIAPLLADTYAKITLVDLRYIASSLIGNYMEFHGQDVLFLYSAPLLNSGMLLK